MRAALLLALIFGAYAGADMVERGTEARLAMAGALREACVPGPGATAIIVSDGRTANCRIYSTASTTLGMAPRLISAAAVGIEP